MIRNLSIIAAVMALSGATASVVLAAPEYTTSSYPGAVTSANTKGSEVFTTEAGKTECESHYVSHSISSPSSTLMITPKYTGCTAFGLSSTINTEGCGYVFHATERFAASMHLHHVDVSCPAGQSIKIIGGGGICRAEIKSQAGLTTVRTTNLANGTITAELLIEGIAYTVTHDGFGCLFNGTGNKTGGIYSGHLVFARVGGGSVEVSGE